MTVEFNAERLRPSSPHFGETHHALREQIRRFVATEIAPNLDAWDADRAIPRELHYKAAALGILQLGYPERYGGVSDGIDMFHKLVRDEEIHASGSAGVSAALLTHGIGLPPIIAKGSDDLKQRVAPGVLAGEKLIGLAITEPSGGSDVASVRTKAVRDGDHFVVNGSKTYITSGMRADYLTTAVRTGGPGGRVCRCCSSRRTVTASSGPHWKRWVGTAPTRRVFLLTMFACRSTISSARRMPVSPAS
jgi:acyl-CoA dehydrogenase